jgi:DNA-binding GntR family transcriptional regulator
MKELVKKDNNIPLYLQLMSIFMENITTGHWPVGEKIPSEKELAQQYGVSLITVRKTLEQLNKDSIIYKIQGKGSFVSYNDTGKYDLRFKEIKSFTEEMSQTYKKAGAVVLSVKIVSASQQDAADFNLPVNAPLLEVKRLRTVDNIPTHISTARMPKEIGDQLKNADFSQSIYELLRGLGYSLTGGREEIEAGLPTKEEAERLGINSNMPVLDTRSVIKDNNCVICITRSIINSKRIKITVDLSKDI